MSGFIALHRTLLDWEWYSEPNTCRVFIHCLLKANWKDKNYRGKVVKRGHFLTSLEVLAQETGLSVRSVRTAIKNLKATHELTVIGTRQGTEIIINNYDSYQEPTSKPTNGRQTELGGDDGNKPKSGQKATSEATNEDQPEATENKEETNNDCDEATHEATDGRQTGDKQATYEATTTNKVNKDNKSNKNIYKRRLPEDFDLPQKWIDSAIKYWSSKNRTDLNPYEQFSQFKSHHLANGTTSTDFKYNWQTWYTRAVQYNQLKGAGYAANQQFNQQPKLSTVEQASRANAEHYAELERQEAELDAQQGHDKALGNAYP